MNVSSIVNKTIKLVTPSMHATRRNALLCCINSLLQGNAATVTSIGRGIDSDTTDKHSIKRADRLCSNNYLLAETEGVYGAICGLFCQNSSRPIILVDWSDLDESKRHFLIRASLAFDGRSITLYEEIHELNTKEKPATHAAFLAKLKEKLGVDVKPIIVTDAGFKTPWFREVLALQWDFLGRTRLPNFYKLNNQKTWKSISHFYKQAGTKPKARSGAINQSNPLDCRLIIYKQESQGRQDLNRYGEARKSTNAKKYAKGANDPWLLSTSLKMTNTLGKKAVSIYRKRMQIEEEFRDMKSSTYGLGFEQSRTRILLFRFHDSDPICPAVSRLFRLIYRISILLQSSVVVLVPHRHHVPLTIPPIFSPKSLGRNKYCLESHP
jgi:hypothetical protein